MTPAEEAEPDPEHEERGRRRARLKAAALGRSRGGLTTKVHLSADRRCRPLPFVITPGQAADSPQFSAVRARVRVRGPVGRPHTRPGAVAWPETRRTPPEPTAPIYGNGRSRR